MGMYVFTPVANVPSENASFADEFGQLIGYTGSRGDYKKLLSFYKNLDFIRVFTARPEQFFSKVGWTGFPTLHEWLSILSYSTLYKYIYEKVKRYTGFLEYTSSIPCFAIHAYSWARWKFTSSTIPAKTYHFHESGTDNYRILSKRSLHGLRSTS